METFLAALIVFGGVVAGMAVGVIFGKRQLRGSCGGLSAWRDELGRPMCEACAECPEKRDECELREAGEDEDAGMELDEESEPEREERRVTSAGARR